MNMAVRDIRISETGDYERLVILFVENGLEFSAEDVVPTDLVKCWKAEEERGGVFGDEGSAAVAVFGGGGAAAAGATLKLVGGCVLAKREGHFICDGIATDPSARGQRVGERLLFAMIDEVRALGDNALYLVARAPGFFAKYGFAAVPRDAAPTFFECFSCPQYGISCQPEVMRLDIPPGTIDMKLEESMDSKTLDEEEVAERLERLGIA